MQVMISDYLDKKQDFCSMSYIEQVKYMAYFFVKISEDQVFQSKNISHFFYLARIDKPANVSNMFTILKKRKVFIPVKGGYFFHRDEFRLLEEEFSKNKPKVKISKTLRSLLQKMKDENKRIFLEEAIQCYEIDAYRSSIVMIWLLVIDHLYEYIIQNKLPDFNNALKKQNLKIKSIVQKEDFSELKESKFIEICRSARIISNDVRKILDEKLGIRNSCAHPNNIKV